MSSSQEEHKDEAGETATVGGAAAAAAGTHTAAVPPSGSALDQAKQDAANMNLQSMFEDMERQYHELRQDRDNLQAQLQQSQKANREGSAVAVESQELKTKVTQLESELQARKSELDLSQQKQKDVDERSARVQAEADRLRQEISQLTEKNSELGSQLASREMESKLQESEAIPLLHERDSLKSEMASLQTHANWLQGELEAKTAAYQRLQHETHDRQLQLQLQLQQTENDKEAFAVREEELRKIEGRLQSQVEQSSRDMMLAKQELASVKESTALEIQQERKLADLQKEHLLRWEQRYNDVVRENESLKQAAGEAQALMDSQIEQLRTELEAKHKKELEEQASDRRARIEDQPAAVPALPAPSDEDGAPMGLTEVYERLEKAKEQYRQEKLRADRADVLNRRFVKEIKEKTPILARQREEYELAMDQMQDYQSRLEQALRDKEEANNDSNEARRAAGKWRRQYEDKQSECKTLAKQVQSLLVSRAGGSEADIPNDVARMQSQNQQLLVENERLQVKVDELEDRLGADEMSTKLEAAKAELDALRQQRLLQEQAVEKIVQQRDLYRSLCNLSTNMSSSQELTVQEFSKEQVEKVKKLEKELAEADEKLAVMSGEHDKLRREKEAAEERLARYEAYQKDLSERADRLESDLHVARGDLARGKQEAKYHTEKSLRLEEAAQRVRDDNSSLTNAKNELQRINAELQHSLTEAKSLVNQKETEKQQAETKLRLAESQAEAAKMAQKRAADEATQLRAEVARQGTLVDSVRRIETSLAARSEGELETLREEVDRLKKMGASEKKRLEVEMADLRERASAAEARFQEAVAAKDKAVSDLESSRASLAEARKISEQAKPGDDIAQKAQVDALLVELENAKAEIASLKESANAYKTAAKTSEASVADVASVAESAKKELQEELDRTRASLENSRKESLAKQEMIAEMTKTLSVQREEREKAEGALKTELSSVRSESQVREKDLESAQAALAAAKLDLQNIRLEESDARSNYARELKLHAEARGSLRAALEKAEEEAANRTKAAQEVENLKSSIETERSTWTKEQDALRETLQTVENKLKDAREQNDLLHSQLEKLSEQVEKKMASAASTSQEGEDAGSEEQKQFKEMREIVRFLRSENQTVQTQRDTAIRGVEREKAAAAVLQHSLDEARAELYSLKEAKEAGKSSSVELTGVKDRLRASDEQVSLLTDSNRLLREECQKLRDNLRSLQSDMDALQKQLEPAEKFKLDSEAKLAALQAEKESLMRELSSWKGRVENLVNKFNQVDPEEHRKALGRVEELTKEKEAADKWKENMETENKRLRDIARRQNQQQRELRGQIEDKDKQIAKLEAEKSSSKEAGLVKEVDELNGKLAKLEKESASVKAELEGANARNEKLRDRLRQFQTTIRDLKNKEQSLTDDLASARSSLEQAKKKALEEAQKSSTQAQKPSVLASPVPLEAVGETSNVDQTEVRPLDASRPAQLEGLSVPDGGFSFGPSPQSSVQSTEADKEASKPDEDEKAGLRADAPSFVPSKIETAKPADVPAVRPGVKRQASGETMELSVKEKLMAKKRKLAELTKRKIEASKALKKAGDTAEGNADQDLQSLPESRGTSPVPASAHPKRISKDEDLKPASEGSAGGEKPGPQADAPASIPPIVAPESKQEQSTGVEPFKPSTPVPSVDPPSAVATVAEMVKQAIPAAAATKPGVGGGGGAFLDMKPPDSSSSPPTFSFAKSGTIALPVPSQTAPPPSPFGAFGGASSFGSATAPFGGNLKTDQPAARPLFGEPASSSAEGKEDDKGEEAKP